MADYDTLATLLCFVMTLMLPVRVVEYKFIVHVFFNSILECPRDFSFFFFLRPLLFYILPQLLSSSLNHLCGTSLVAQWLRICLLQARSLTWEDSTCNEASVPKPLKPTHSRVHAPQQEAPPQWEAHTPQLGSSPSLQLEEAHVQHQRPSTAKILVDFFN